MRTPHGAGKGRRKRPPARSTGPAVPAARFEVTRARLEEARLAAATASDPHRRVEALRVVGLSDLPTDQKAALAVRALIDESAEIRRAAVRELRALGMAEHLCANLARLADPSAEARGAAARNLARVFAADARAAALLVPVLAEAVLGERDPLVLRAAAEMFQARPEALAKRQDLLERLLFHLLPLAEDAGDGPAQLARFLEAFVRSSPRAMDDCLGEALRGTGSPRARRFLLGQRLRLPIGTDSRREAAGLLAEELSRLARGFEAMEAAEALASSPQEGARAILERLERFHARSEGIAALDRIAASRDAAPETIAAVARALVQAVRSWPESYLPDLLECSIWHGHRLDKPLRGQAAAALAAQLPRVLAPALRNELGDVLERMGEAALAPLDALVRGGGAPEDRIQAALWFGRIAQTCARAPRALLHGTADALLADEALSPAWDALGRIAASSAADKALAERIALTLTQRWEARRAAVDALRGLSWLPSAPRLSPAARAAHATRLLELLRTGFGGKDKGVVDLDRVWAESALQAECVPLLLEGLGVAALARTLPPGAVQGIFYAFLDAWREVRSWKRIWGPSDAARCAHWLGRLVGAGRVAPEAAVRLVADFSSAIDSPSIVRALTEAVAAHPREREFGAACEDLLRQCLEALQGAPSLQDEEASLLPNLVASLAERPSLGAKSRRQAVHALLEGARSRPDLFRRPLERLARSPHVPAPSQTRIRGWLDAEGRRLPAIAR